MNQPVLSELSDPYPSLTAGPALPAIIEDLLDLTPGCEPAAVFADLAWCATRHFATYCEILVVEDTPNHHDIRVPADGPPSAASGADDPALRTSSPL